MHPFLKRWPAHVVLLLLITAVSGTLMRFIYGYRIYYDKKNHFQTKLCGNDLCPGVACNPEDDKKCAFYLSEDECKLKCSKCKFQEQMERYVNGKPQFQKDVFYCPINSVKSSDLQLVTYTALTAILSIVLIVMLIYQQKLKKQANRSKLIE